MADVVVVESPAKAKTINKYLGSDYTVLATVGHIRDLSDKEGAVRPDDDFSMDWEIDPKSQKQINQIAKAVKGARHLYLATDPDREGEAISWHVHNALEEKNVLRGISVKRVVFNEVTRDAVLTAFQHPREIDLELVDAYLARRVLDRLMGYELSNILRRKLPRSQSAGRVQSVALKLICERETEIEAFKQEEYWSIAGSCKTPEGKDFSAQLAILEGVKLKKMDIQSEDAAVRAVAAIKSKTFSVASLQKKQVKRHPAAPFTTSTLQQEAARKLYFPARKTMVVAQGLYQGVAINGELTGLITYMRTDGVQMAAESISACRNLIISDFDTRYLPPTPRVYKTKAKNAQEAHEAIRPTNILRRPKDISSYLTDEQNKLYTLIWGRTIASQMEAAILDQVSININSDDDQFSFRATGSIVSFDGFRRIYKEGSDQEDDNADENRLLPQMKNGDLVTLSDAVPTQHFTQPLPRYSEASLVKKLEELGIGRPSTYHTTLSRLQDHNYVKLDKRRFEPEDRARLVTTFLGNFFTRYVEYGYTADLERQLDDISGGRLNWKNVLREFWNEFSKAVEETKELRVSKVLDVLNDILGPHFFPLRPDGSDPRKCIACDSGTLTIKNGKFGAFIGCSNHPDCSLTRPLAIMNGENAEAEIVDTGPKILGIDPTSNLEVSIRRGPYGAYTQLGEAEGKKKPKRASILKTISPEDVTLEIALSLLSLPRHVGVDPETGEEITAGIGRFGPFIKTGGTYVSLKGEDDVLTIGANRAIDLLASKPRKAPPKEIGPHPKDKKSIFIKEGHYGPYIQHGQGRASIPKGINKENVTLELAIELLAAKKSKKSERKGPKNTKRKK